MRIAVVGSGIAGLATAWLLSTRHAVTLFEAADRLGGHTDTHDIELGGRRYAIDTGFIVFNHAHYPLLTRLLDDLRVASQPTTMSFSVHNEASGLEYSATNLDTLFCQRRNLCSPRFLGMLRDLLRFYREAPALLGEPAPGPTLAEYLAERGFGVAFRDEHLVPMAAALWSAPPGEVLGFPAQFVVRFMANHHMLTLRGRPEWRVIRGGSSSYVHALRKRWNVSERLACPVHAVRRQTAGVLIDSPAGTERFDHVVLACHSDQSLALLHDASDMERKVLGAIPYQPNEVLLHTDTSVLPRNRRAWAAWNAFVPRAAGRSCSVSYCMNLLQGISAPETFVVTLNGTDLVRPEKVLRRLSYAHPLYTASAVAAQCQRAQLQGQRRTWLAGAYWGWGFHEDGLRSAVEVAQALGVEWGEARASSAALTATTPLVAPGLAT
ncbi:MAG TPA: FAD-dependent oxidoreductase [Steroidobacteraceae bacterium]|nr:FAD-dependent oxidoreductase [Steroidobacteraceae bacterium]